MSKRRKTPDSYEAYVVYKDDIPKYIGITIRGTAIRWQEHQKTYSQNTALANAMRKYGVDCFTIEHIASARTSDELLELERILIVQHRTMSPYGYNLKEGGAQNFRFSDETRARMAARQKGVTPTEETRKKLSAKARGRKPPPQSRESILRGALARTGKKYGPLSDQRKANIRVSLVGRPGHSLSEEAREKIAASKRGKPLSAEHRLKLSTVRKGQRTGPRGPYSAEQRAAMRAGWKARAARIQSQSGQMDLAL